MPFVKLGENRYRGPSGKVFNEKQVQLYYARGGTFAPSVKSRSSTPRLSRKGKL